MYIVNVELKATQSGYKADMSFTDKEGRIHEKHIENRERYTMQGNYLAALIAVLETLENPCMLSIYSHSDYIAEPIRQGWLNSWAVHEWRNAKGKTVRNVEQWQQVKKTAGQSFSEIYNQRREGGNTRCLIDLENLIP